MARLSGTRIGPILLASLIVGSVFGCAPPPPPPPPPRPPDVFVLLVDTLRSDRVGAYGTSRRLTPFLDTLAARAVVFGHAYAQCSWTAPSVASLFTSRFQTQHGIVGFASRLDVVELTIAELLHDHGYATGAFLANPGMPEVLGWAQGFDVYKSFSPEKKDGKDVKARGEVIGTEALRWIDGLPKDDKRPPVFAYLHYLEPHLPYTPPDGMLDRVSIGRERPNVQRANVSMFFSGAMAPDTAALRNLQDVYDAEVLSIDETLRHTFAALAARHLLDNAVVVFTADHGEELLDHGHLGHGGTLYNELIRVPLLLATPGQTTRLDVKDAVSLIDVAPTVADFAGITPPASWEGRSLRSLLPRPQPPWWRQLFQRREPPPPPRAAMSELLNVPGMERSRTAPHERAIMLDTRKLILGPDGELEQYDLGRDPAETMRVERVDADLQEAAAAFKARTGELAIGPGPPPTLPPELSERLKALGYVH